MPSRFEEDLATLKLKKGAKLGEIRRAFFKLAKVTHPDKPGGSNEAFRRVQEAYERLLSNPPDSTRRETSGEAASGSASQRDYDHKWYYEWFENFWRHQEKNYDDQKNWEAKFARDSAAREKRRRERRASLIKANVDPLLRDVRASSNEDRCQTILDYGRRCEKAPIDKKIALQHGVNWKEYAAHPQGRKTCWRCKTVKTSHRSVLTEAMARQRPWKDVSGNKLGKVLDTARGATIFKTLRREKKSFHHRPVTDHAKRTRNSEYFWAADLQEFAQDQPPIERKPRGHSKRKAEDASHSSPPRQTVKAEDEEPSLSTPVQKIPRRRETERICF